MTKPLHFIILLGLCLLLYWPHAKAEFVLDGHFVVAHNPTIKTPALWKDAFRQDLFHAYKSIHSSKLKYYRPVLELSYMIDYRFWRLNVAGYLFFNLLLHWANAMLLYGLIFLLFKERNLAFMAVVIFCIHPVQEWVVAYVVGRGDLLHGLFALLSLNALLLSWSGKKAWWVVSLASFVLALLSREASILLPGYVFLLGTFYFRDWKKALAASGPFFVIAIIYYVLRQILFPISALSATSFFDGAFLLEWGTVVSQYLLRFLAPWTVFTHWPELFHQTSVQWILAAALVGSCAFVLVRKKLAGLTEAAWVGFGWLMVSLFSLVTTLHMFDHLGPYLAEHFLYWPSIGFALLVAALLKGLPSPRASGAIMLALCAYFLTVGIMNRSAWTSEQAILEKTRAIDPNPDSLAAQQLAMRFETDEVKIRHFIDTAPDAIKKSIWQKRLGYVHHKKGNYEQAIVHLKEAIASNPNNLDAVNELAICYLETNRLNEGYAILMESLNKDPAYFDTNHIMGTALYRQGLFHKAAQFLQAAHAYAPENPDAAFHATMALFFAGDEDGFKRSMGELLEDSDEPAKLYKRVAQELFAWGRYAQVVALLDQAQAITQSDPELQQLRAAALRK